jgi:hypothetical protein
MWPLCHTRFVQWKRLGTIALSVSFAGTTLVACGESIPIPDAATFCEELRNNRSAIVSGTISNELEMTTTLELYRRLDALAPLAVSQEWAVVLNAIETANTVVPGDQDGVQRVAAAAYQSEAAALAIAEWAMTSCEVDLGPVTTLVPHDAPEPAKPVGAEN